MARLATALSRSYRIERELGAGGMATVYLAQDLKHDRQVAGVEAREPMFDKLKTNARYLALLKRLGSTPCPPLPRWPIPPRPR